MQAISAYFVTIKIKYLSTTADFIASNAFFLVVRYVLRYIASNFLFPMLLNI